MSEYLFRHASDFGHPTDVAMFEHCLGWSQEKVITDTGLTHQDAMGVLAQELPFAVGSPEGFDFGGLSWSMMRWPVNKATLLFGIDPDECTDPSIQNALGTITLWNESVHMAGLQYTEPSAQAAQTGRVFAARYVPNVDLNCDMKYELFRGDVVVSQAELGMDDAQLATAARKQYSYLGPGDCLIERPYLGAVPSMFDQKTERPFDNAALITQGMIDKAWNGKGQDPRTERPVAFTFFHEHWVIPSFMKNWASRNKLLQRSNHISPLEGDAHQITIDGHLYELSTSLPRVR